MSFVCIFELTGDDFSYLIYTLVIYFCKTVMLSDYDFTSCSSSLSYLLHILSQLYICCQSITLLACRGLVCCNIFAFHSYNHNFEVIAAELIHCHPKYTHLHTSMVFSICYNTTTRFYIAFQKCSIADVINAASHHLYFHYSFLLPICRIL